MKPRPRPEPVGTPVRWQQGHHGTWHYGHTPSDLAAREPDGSVRVWETSTGGARSLPLASLQHQTRGPRGGKHWDWIEPRPSSQPAPSDTGRAWRPALGKVELFNQQTLFVDTEPVS